LNVPREDEPRHIASNIAKLPVLLGAAEDSDWDSQKAAVSRRRFAASVAWGFTELGI
jgi:hypothetical protein